MRTKHQQEDKKLLLEIKNNWGWIKHLESLAFALKG